MKSFFDTSVLVAAFYGDHPRHEPSLQVFAASNKKQACCAAHSLAEVYSVMTRLPVKPVITPEQAMLFLEAARERLTLVSLHPAEYFAAIEQAAGLRVTGGKIYDALIVRCAIKARAEAIYTWNVTDFARFAPWAADRVRTP